MDILYIDKIKQRNLGKIFYLQKKGKTYFHIEKSKIIILLHPNEWRAFFNLPAVFVGIVFIL